MTARAIAPAARDSTRSIRRPAPSRRRCGSPRCEIGYYDDLPTSAFIHEYRAFYAESLSSIARRSLLPDDRAWRSRRVGADVEELPAVCR